MSTTHKVQTTATIATTTMQQLSVNPGTYAIIAVDDPVTPTETLAVAAGNYRVAQENLDTRREQLAQAVRDAVAGGMSQSEAARIVGVDRLTIRKWIAS